jgi:hypothetical protein
MRPRQRLQGPFVAEKCALTPGGKDTMPIPSKAAKQVQSDRVLAHNPPEGKVH